MTKWMDHPFGCTKHADCRFVVVFVHRGNWTVSAIVPEGFNARQIWKLFGESDHLIWDNETETIADSLMRG